MTRHDSADLPEGPEAAPASEGAASADAIGPAGAPGDQGTDPVRPADPDGIGRPSVAPGVSDPVAWFAERGLTPAGAEMVDLEAYSALLEAARTDGGPAFRDWVTTAMERHGVAMRLRHRTGFALRRDHERRCPSVASAAPERDDTGPAAGAGTDPGHARRAASGEVVVHRADGRWQVLDAGTGSVIREGRAPAGPDGLPMRGGEPYRVRLRRPIDTGDETLPTGAEADVVYVPAGEVRLVKAGSYRLLTPVDLATDVEFVEVRADVAPPAPASKRRRW